MQKSDSMQPLPEHRVLWCIHRVLFLGRNALIRKIDKWALDSLSIFLFVCFNNLFYQWMANDISSVQINETNSFHVTEVADGFFESGFLMLWQVDLRSIPSNNEPRAFSHACQKHLHLRGSRVLTFVENNKGIVQGASAHKGQWRNLYSFIFKVKFQFFFRNHVPQCIVQRGQIGIKFLL